MKTLLFSIFAVFCLTGCSERPVVADLADLTATVSMGLLTLFVFFFPSFKNLI
jgi:hypothetical protein